MRCVLPEFKLKVKISVADENFRGFFGIGIVWLLEEVNKTGSIKKAAEKLGMSYSKAHKILKRVEDKTGNKLLKKSRGGIQRGGSELTDYAKKLMKNYKEFQENVKKFSEHEFENKIKNIL
jgi:molybdate transport system regulatory protein